MHKKVIVATKKTCFILLQKPIKCVKEKFIKKILYKVKWRQLTEDFGSGAAAGTNFCEETEEGRNNSLQLRSFRNNEFEGFSFYKDKLTFVSSNAFPDYRIL